ncbi:hypothetical protein EYA84_02505 [Verrucosispora sp. SN26_14.1]|uniref:PD-(D/E)XK nuclease domain-containing protein n=1 Tax=Verrucosispora sp. SN26_14.1 TaxID=2527879 RepID=UPI001034EEC6|nr:hypothetical protein [Verrucosispora sp. SN26_14.1]TBL43326.1 hypothetical protein EYA84_02505 [Verrucosispora sp. SN26_14.1]
MTGQGPDAQTVVVAQLADQMAALDSHLGYANKPGDLDGLFAHHFLSSVDVSFAWEVNPLTAQWLNQHTDRLRHAPGLAVLGFALHDFRDHRDLGMNERLVDGLRDLMRRDPFPADRTTFVTDRRQLLGITLAALVARDALLAFHSWLLDVLHDSRFRADDPRTDLARRHSLAVLTDEPAPLGGLAGVKNLPELCMVHWMSIASTARLADPAADLQLIQRRILTGLLRTDIADLSTCDAALVRAAAGRIIDASIDSTVLTRSHVGIVLRRFPAAMKRWRWDDPDDVRHPIRWEVNSEREVQDIVWIMLRSVFSDLVDEEPLPRLGHSSYRADFGIPRLGILIEIKYVRSATDFKKVEKEILEDSIAYLRERGTYTKLIVFIYDASASNQEHDITTAALLERDDIIDVIIVSRPSQLPATATPGTASSLRRSRIRRSPNSP